MHALLTTASSTNRHAPSWPGAAAGAGKPTFQPVSSPSSRASSSRALLYLMKSFFSTWGARTRGEDGGAGGEGGESGGPGGESRAGQVHLGVQQQALKSGGCTRAHAQCALPCSSQSPPLPPPTRMRMVARKPVRSSTVTHELTMENQWIWGVGGRAGGPVWHSGWWQERKQEKGGCGRHKWAANISWGDTQQSGRQG